MLNNILSLFVKPNCPLCQRTAKQIICQYCEQKLRSCQLIDYKQFSDPNFLLFPWGKYDSYLKQAIASFKFDRKKDMGELLGMWLGEAWLECGWGKIYKKMTVIPIPLHPEKLKTRGFNQAELIASSFCDVTGYQLKTNLLIRVKNTEAMFGLNPQQRKTNINEAFGLGKDYHKINKSQPILMIDDIYTTGATVNEGKKVLTQKNLKIIGVATVSVTKF
ncbi:MAG: ComF family protein [Cyanobacteria bacterium]|nr:ComF family protein [Cyanobacteria bacterium CG_2015-16_32_12]NCO79588.1 ComF family protein [Cyanobacteria bacterium CG_2015-22_32_23]NCQ03541.1 ComF family protein [Cyanobacteria bacterium CG_2015-09_32_10]NCQ42667.1 ComF family protein [Cyanobacteria bacterium CG_2015-04_32_10]NCS85513.1 ComF family protein [Cyanobacteria bacterium CG_2015-02_32_10]